MAELTKPFQLPLPLRIKIRHIQKEDLPRVIACNKAHISETYPAFFYDYCLSLGEDICYLIEDTVTKELVGYSLTIINHPSSLVSSKELHELFSTEDNKNHAHVVSLVIAPEYRRRGLARKLMQKTIRLLNIIYTDHISSLTLHVRQSNTAAQALYQSLGFGTICIVPRYYSDPPDPEDGYLMKLNLATLSV